MAINLEQVDSQVAAARGNKDVARAQAILAQLGHYNAGVDGIIGGKTREAIDALLKNQTVFEDLSSADRSQIQVALQNVGRVALNGENGEAVKTANTRIDEFQRSCAQREAKAVAAAVVAPSAPVQEAAPAATQEAPAQEASVPLPPVRPADVPKFANAQEERTSRIRDAQGALHDKGYYPQGVSRDQAVDGKIGPQTRAAAGKAKDAVGKATENGAEAPAELQDVVKAQDTIKELGGESTKTQKAAVAAKPEKEAAPRHRARPAADKDDADKGDDDKGKSARQKAVHKPGNGAAHDKQGGKVNPLGWTEYGQYGKQKHTGPRTDHNPVIDKFYENREPVRTFNGGEDPVERAAKAKLAGEEWRKNGRSIDPNKLSTEDQKKVNKIKQGMEQELARVGEPGARNSHEVLGTAPNFFPVFGNGKLSDGSEVVKGDRLHKDKKGNKNIVVTTGDSRLIGDKIMGNPALDRDGEHEMYAPANPGPIDKKRPWPADHGSVSVKTRNFKDPKTGKNVRVQIPNNGTIVTPSGGGADGAAASPAAPSGPDGCGCGAPGGPGGPGGGTGR